MSWIQTYTGMKFHPLAPSADEVCIEDIAHALAYKCRYTGHTKGFYGVAEHCVKGSETFKRSDLALAFLLHDAAEAYLPDIAGPIKKYFRVHTPGTAAFTDPVTFDELEGRVLKAIGRALGDIGSAAFNSPEVVAMDQAMLLSEKEALFDKRLDWGLEGRAPPVKIECWAPAVAEKKYLERFKKLRAER